MPSSATPSATTMPQPGTLFQVESWLFWSVFLMILQHAFVCIFFTHGLYLARFVSPTRFCQSGACAGPQIACCWSKRTKILLGASWHPTQASQALRVTASQTGQFKTKLFDRFCLYCSPLPYRSTPYAQAPRGLFRAVTYHKRGAWVQEGRGVVSIIFFTHTQTTCFDPTNLRKLGFQSVLSLCHLSEPPHQRPGPL